MIVKSFLLCNKYGQNVGFMRDNFFNKNIMILLTKNIMILINDNDLFKCKDFDYYLLFKMNFFDVYG
jgi:hypothetical protein